MYTGPATPPAVASAAAPPRNVGIESVKTPKMVIISVPNTALGYSPYGALRIFNIASRVLIFRYSVHTRGRPHRPRSPTLRPRPETWYSGALKRQKWQSFGPQTQPLGLSGETDNPAHARPRDKIFKSVIRNVAVRDARYRVPPRPAANVVFSWRGKSSRSGIISPTFDSP